MRFGGRCPSRTATPARASPRLIPAKAITIFLEDTQAARAPFPPPRAILGVGQHQNRWRGCWSASALVFLNTMQAARMPFTFCFLELLFLFECQ